MGRTTQSKMKYLAAYMLAVEGGNNTPSESDVKDILGSIGAEVDEAQLSTLFAQLEGKDLKELLAAGLEKLPQMGGCGGGGAAAAAGGDGGDGAPAAEEKKESSSDSDDGAGAAGMFDEDY